MVLPDASFFSTYAERKKEEFAGVNGTQRLQCQGHTKEQSCGESPAHRYGWGPLRDRDTVQRGGNKLPVEWSRFRVLQDQKAAIGNAVW